MAESYTYTLSSSNKKKWVTLVCTADTDGSFDITLSAAIMNFMAGNYCRCIKAAPTTDGTAPTNNSDLSITDSFGVVLMSASVNGANLIPAALPALWNYCDGPLSAGSDYPLVDANYAWTMSVTNNIVNGADFTLIIELVD